ncbi:hypothetical protein [Coxiella burnetii]|uniref:hypothetical protein n=1 Tax=Coxiella burnetii TaxID=777 RepID=UPI00051F1974|nr:hypothetical protein [Coxiella burnetii]AIT63769.1 hypothetical protein CBNA_1533 [Coxiella burnetii str. Namibia]
MLVGVVLAFVLLLTAWVLVLLGVGFVLTSFYFYLTTHIGPILSAFICGLIIFILALILIGLVTLFKKMKVSKTKSQVKSAIPDVFSIISKHFGKSILGIGAAGFLLGFSKEARETLINSCCSLFKKYIEEINDKSDDDKRH